MKYTNSYFTLDIDDTRVYMNYYPPVDDGEVLKISEITEILDKNRIEDYDIKVINEAVVQAKEPVRIKISSQGAYQFNESMNLKITPDGMYAIARFYPASNQGNRMSEKEIKRDLEYYKVQYGIQESVIKKHLAEPEYFKNVLIALGKKPRQGHDGSITYNFNTDRTVKPRLNEDGTVDFHKLDNIAHIKSGDILATITPVDKGESGVNVYGVEIKPERVVKVNFKYGHNMHISEDGLQLISDVDGCATLEGDKVFVSNLYDIPHDVDNSTGDVEFNGGILVRGNVRTGFRLKAVGNIEVFGVVEGAELEAGGDIILHRGIQGMNRCTIKAGGNLVSKFIESAQVKVDGYLHAESIFNSQISAKGDIVVSGRAGSIIGGNVRSATMIEATSIGTAMGAATSVEVGIDPSIRDRMKEIEQIISNKTAEIDKFEQLITVFRKKQELGTLDKEKEKMISQFTKTVIVNKTEIKALNTEYEIHERSLEENENAKIRVTKDIHSGTKVTVSGTFIILHDTYSHCMYMKKRGEIVSSIW